MLFFLNDPATTEIYTLSLHDALPISRRRWPPPRTSMPPWRRATTTPWARCGSPTWWAWTCAWRSEEHTSELQSHSDLVCRLLLEKKKQLTIIGHYFIGIN